MSPEQSDYQSKGNETFMIRIIFVVFVVLNIAFSHLAFSQSSNDCSEESIDTIQQAYIAYYGRPGDPGGVSFWCEKLDKENGSLDAIIGQFGNSEEFEDRYGSFSNGELIDTVYQQMFGRDPDESGREFYVGRLNSGAMTLQTITLNVLFGSTGTDATIIDTRIQVARYFTGRVSATGYVYDESTIDSVREMILGVGVSSDAYDLATADIETLVDPEGNSPPLLVEILSDDSVYELGSEVILSALAVVGDVTLSGNAFVWTSNIDGNLGFGNDLNLSILSAGAHTVTVTATENVLSNTASLEIKIVQGLFEGTYRVAQDDIEDSCGDFVSDFSDYVLVMASGAEYTVSFGTSVLHFSLNSEGNLRSVQSLSFTDGGGTTNSEVDIIISPDGTLFGMESWEWSDGSCTGTTQLIGSKIN